MTREQFLRKYRTRMLGLAATYIVESPAVVVSLVERSAVAEARGKRVEALEQLGRDIDSTMQEMLRDWPGEAAANGHAAAAGRLPAANGAHKANGHATAAPAKT